VRRFSGAVNALGGGMYTEGQHLSPIGSFHEIDR
jgi:hypothetical protein